MYVADTATTEYKYSPAMVLSYQNGENMAVGNGSFNSPAGIAVDPSSGNVYVADTAIIEYKYSLAMVLSYQNGENTVRMAIRMRFPEGIAVDHIW